MTSQREPVENVLSRLIAYPTICETPNEELIAYVESELSTLGFRITKLPSSHPGRLSLLASIGPETNKGIVFSAHSDVVPVEGQPWTSDPFTMAEVDGSKLVGRGTSDMKGFLACMLVAARHASAVQHELKDPLHLAVSYDEEVGCVGVRSLLAHLKSMHFQARGCIIGEPTELNIVTGHKGKQAVSVVCTGLSAHSSNPDRGCNAVLLACELIKEVELVQQENRDAVDVHDETYEVPFSTAQVGKINGGVALNIVPDRCEFQFEMRLLAGSDGDAVVRRVQAVADKILATPKFKHGGVEIKTLNAYPGLSTPDADSFTQAIARASPESRVGTRINFGTEGGLFQEFLDNIPVVVCGPGSIDRAHKADEWVMKEELQACTQVLDRVIDQLKL